MKSTFTGFQFVWWHGVIEDINDPLKLGRCRVRILGFHSDNKNDLPTEHLPWAPVMMPVTSASMSGIGASPTGLLCGSWVIGFFRDECFQEPLIMGSFHGLPEYKVPPNRGFSDPNNEYPKSDHLNEADTSRLSRNEKVDKTLVALKKIDVEKDIKAALNKEKWEEPETPYDAEYPKNHVIETESGHVLEMDDTTNKERIHVYHKSGTFTEIHPDGSRVEKIKGKNYTIIAEENRILIKKTQSENIKGDYNLSTSGDLNIQIEGDANILVKGNTTIETKGDHFQKCDGVMAFISSDNMMFSAPRIDFNPEDISGSIGDVL